jgi:3-hydroxy acid dehydrogenase/malonic semialdehyde reductase
LTTLYPQIAIHIFELDVRNYDEVKSKVESLPAEWKNIHVLINNAGLSQGLDIMLQ